MGLVFGPTQKGEAMEEKQLATSISLSTKERLDEFTRKRGMKKSWVVEQALLAFMAACEEIPLEEFVSPRIVVDAETWAQIERDLESPPPPTAALKELRRGRNRNPKIAAD